MADAPNSYKDPYWTNLSTMMEKKHGLPSGLLVNIVQKGEKTNNDKRSPVGAKTVYQIMPNTRNLFLKKYGVDAFASPSAAAEVAALHLKESLQRNKGDASLAVREYHGGPNRKGWGKVNDAYVGRVLGDNGQPQQAEQPSRLDRARQKVSSRRELEQPTLDSIYRAYKGGQMSAQEKADYERDVKNGSIMLSRGQSLSGGKKSQDENGVLLPQGVADAYYKNTMTPEDRADLERDRKAGLVRLPTPTNMQSDLPDFNQQGVIREDQPIEATQPKPELSLGQKIIGAGEAALSAGTGAVGGILGTAGGALYGAGREIASGEFGSHEAAQRIAQTAAQGAQTLTYEPQTQGGQRIMQSVGQIAEDTGLTSLPPTLGGGLGTTAATLGRASIPTATVAARDVAQAAKPAISQIVDTAKAGGQRAVDMVTGGSGISRPSASMGAAQVDDVTRRVTMANELPVPLGQLHTEGTATRDPYQLKFEAETAKSEVGAPLINRVEERHAGVIQNMDAFNEATGAQLNDKYQVGGAISSALQKEYANDKTKTRAAYAAADKSDESKTVVDLSRPVSNIIDGQDTTLTDYLNGTVEGATETIIPTARKLAVHHGIADEVDGALVPKAATIKQLENFRKDITAKTDSKEGADMRQAAILKGLVDGHTEPFEGTLYKKARAARTEQAKRWERNSILDRIMGTKRNTEDRKVALEDVVDTIINRGSKDDVDLVRKTLLSSGDDGKQAMSELQGALLRDIQEQATKGVAPDANGQPMVSPAALNKAISSVDDKLDSILGKQSADKLRLLNDVSKDLLTLPASAAVNHSNTAAAMSAIAAMIDATLMMGAGVPAPVASALKLATSHLRNQKLKQRVEKALNLDKSLKGKF